MSVEEKKYSVLYVSSFDEEVGEYLKQIPFFDFGCNGFEEYSAQESEVDEILGEKSYSGGVLPKEILVEFEAKYLSKNKRCYKFYFNDPSHATQCLGFKNYLESEYPKLEYRIQEFEWENWHKNWQQSLSEIQLSEELTIVPWFEETMPPASNDHVYIQPGMGFGTGEHETTKLCLRLFQSLKSIPEYCLDFGSGSGILAITALKKGSSFATCYDIDFDSLENTKANIELNQVESVEVTQKPIFKYDKYDLVFANILLDVLINEKESITSHLKPQGKLIVSGLLRGQRNEFFNNYDNFEMINELVDGDWMAITLERK